MRGFVGSFHCGIVDAVDVNTTRLPQDFRVLEETPEGCVQVGFL